MSDSESVSSSAALPIAYFVLRALVVLNWLGGLMILALLVVLPNQRWIMSSFDMAPGPELDRVVLGLRMIAGLGLVVVLLSWVILKRLLAMVETVRAGDPFVPANAWRLQMIARALLGLQIIGIAIAAIAKWVSTPEHPLKLDAGFSVNGWLAVLLTFLLARVFEEGTRMREDLDGMV